MKNSFNLKKFLVENKLTTNSRLIKEEMSLEDIKTMAIRLLGDESTPVQLTHGYDRYSTKQLNTTLAKALDFIEQQADLSALEAGDVYAEPFAEGTGIMINIGDQEFDITKD